MAGEVTAAALAQGILAGEMRALARAATLIENRKAAGRELLATLAPHTGKAMVVGITGPPGAGKSTLVNQLVKLARSAGQTVGVLAIDPSSPYSQGALLGDRIRMQEHSGDGGVFIRSLASRGAPGGIARATQELALLLDAAGRDLVLIETVGAGQDEVAIARLAAVTVVVLAPGFGDDVQAEKAGMMEIADVFAINKADLPGADRLEQGLRASGIAVPIRRVVATEGTGCAELLSVIHDAYRAATARERIPPASSIQIDHLGIAVRSLDEGLAFYERLLGMRVSRRETVAAEHVSVAMLPAGDASIELLEATDAESAIARFLEKRGPGLHHVALRVDDLAAAIERLKQQGARLLNEPRRGADGHTYVFVHPASAGGVLLELIQK
ncbi:MAG TPA: methylmalonyl Co-A mutase-associated GTPase MeaB [Bryobacteraceae bacterium]